MSFDTQTKLAIYRHFAETGQRPSLQVVAERVGSDLNSIREVYVRLRAQRVLVLEPDGVSIRMAPPFSGVPTQHVVIEPLTLEIGLEGPPPCSWLKQHAFLPVGRTANVCLTTAGM